VNCLEKRWRNLLIIAVILVGAFLAYSFFPAIPFPGPAPEGVDLTTFTASFEESDIEPADAQLDLLVFFDDDGTLVDTISAEQLNSLEASFQQVKSDASSTEGQKDAAELYLQYLDFVEEKKQLYSQISDLDTQLCFELPPYADLQEKSDGLLEQANDLLEQEEAFEDKYDSEPLFLLDLESEISLNTSLEGIYTVAWNECQAVSLE